MVAASVSGAKFGFAVAWAVIIGAFLKFFLNEGIARWQLATGTTILEGWVEKLGAWVKYFFGIYLIVWSFVVGGALISTCGLAAHAIFPVLSLEWWGILHSLLACAFVFSGSYGKFETLMKIMVGLMFLSLVITASLSAPPLETLGNIFTQIDIPLGSSKFILGVIGGVGGSLTLLAYGYWIREKNWKGKEAYGFVRLDLIVAYVLTGIFGLAVMSLAATTLHPKGLGVQGSQGVLQMAHMLEGTLGVYGYWIFTFGFWGAVATSMLGVWQSVPYMFCDFVGILKGLKGREREEFVSTKSKWYRYYLAYIAITPCLLLLVNKPIFLVILYSIVGALFMPFLAGTLLYMNSRKDWVGDLKNGILCQSALILALILFAYLCIASIMEIFGGLI